MHRGTVGGTVGATVGRSTSRAAPVLTLLLVGLLGCTAPAADTPAAPDAQPDTAPAPDEAPTPDARPTPDAEPPPEPDLGAPTTPDVPAPRPDPAPDPDRPGTCDEATRAAMGATLSAQLDALAAEDFTGAYAVTSPFFRTFFTPEAFETLIRDDYPTLVGNLGHRFDECGVVGRRGFLVVGVRAGVGPDELVLRYDLSQEQDGWRIDGALALPAVTLPPEPLV